MLLDFDESKMSRQDHIERLLDLRKGIINNYPDALPDLATAHALFHEVGSILSPAAIALDTNPAFKKASKIMGQKLTHALYLRETRRILTADHRFRCMWYQPQQAGTEALTAYFSSLFPNKTVGNRPNIKPYGDRFGYLSGFKEEEDFLCMPLSSAMDLSSGAACVGQVRKCLRRGLSRRHCGVRDYADPGRVLQHLARLLGEMPTARKFVVAFPPRPPFKPGARCPRFATAFWSLTWDRAEFLEEEFRSRLKLHAFTTPSPNTFSNG